MLNIMDVFMNTKFQKHCSFEQLKNVHEIHNVIQNIILSI